VRNKSSRPEYGAENYSEKIKEKGGARHPVYVRLPKNGTLCPVTGLSRSYLNGLILPNSGNGYKPPVKSVSLRKRGAVRGVRLIPTDVILGYLRDELEKQNKGMD
jgi:hypothetical protein